MSDDLRPADQLGRPLRSLRLSVTDRCNLRCSYCMPEPSYTWLPRAKLLDFDEIGRLVDAFIDIGVERVRLTGGEPLLRRGLTVLISMLRARSALRDVALTTNGLLLAAQAEALAGAGLSRVTVSLDTLQRERFKAIAGRDGLDEVIRGIDAARAAGLDRDLKVDAVIIKGINDDELCDLIGFGKSRGIEVRFIEYMDVGGATQWNEDQVMSRAAMLERVGHELGEPEPLAGRGAAPAERFRLPDGTIFGIVASTTVPFCQLCDRSRVTADGTWYHCLYATEGVDLKTPIRAGASDDELRALLRRHWRRRDNRGAEERARLSRRGAFADAEELQEDPRLEMHTRGG